MYKRNILLEKASFYFFCIRVSTYTVPPRTHPRKNLATPLLLHLKNEIRIPVVLRREITSLIDGRLKARKYANDCEHSATDKSSYAASARRRLVSAKSVMRRIFNQTLSRQI